jgi:hypothetical protein
VGILGKRVTTNKHYTLSADIKLMVRLLLKQTDFCPFAVSLSTNKVSSIKFSVIYARPQ